MVLEGIELCDEIMAGTDDAVESVSVGRRCWYAKAKNERYQRLDGGLCNSAYDKENIWRK